MAERHWVGATNGVWNSTANWSATQGGSGGASVPTTGDDVYIDNPIAAGSFINVNQDIGAINSLTFADNSVSGFSWNLGGGTSNTTTGTTWTVPNNITINTVNGTAVYGILNMSFSGSSNIIKTGGGGLFRAAPTTGSWGTVTIDLQEGYVGGAGVTNTTGTGTITMSNGTGITNASTSTAYSLGNPLVVNGNIYLNTYLDNVSQALASLTLSGTVSLGGTQRTLTCGGTGAAISNPTSISGVVSGTGGFIVEGDPTNYVSITAPLYGLRLLNTGNTVSGNVIVRNVLHMGVPANPPANSGNVLPSVGNIEIDGTSAFVYISTNQDMTAPTFSGTGNLEVFASGGKSVTFPVNGLSNLNNGSSLVGMRFFPFRGGNVNVNDLPAKFTFYAANGPATGFLRYIATNGVNSTFSTNFVLVGSGCNPVIEASGSAGSSLTLSGTISGSTSGLNWYFVGDNDDDNTVSGVISHTTGIIKGGIGKWVFSGNNTYPGTTSITEGTLSAQSNSAFGSSTAGVVSQTGGTIDVSGGIALNKGSLAWTLKSLSGATSLKTSSGTNSITCGGVTLSSTIIVDADSGASLTINNSAAMSGAGFGITKIGLGEIGLGTFANTYTGAITVSDGTLSVGNLQNTNTASSLGTGAVTSAIALTGTLKYVGTGHSTNRSITFTGSSPSLDASGSGAVTYSACTQATGARTITFTGTSTAANTFSAALSNGTGTVSVAKSGTGKWILSNATLDYTGVTTVNAGTLNLNEVPRTLSGAIVINGGILENGTALVSPGGASSVSGGTITAILGGSSTVTITTGATASSPAIFQPADANSNNSLTGSVVVNGEVKIITPDALDFSTGGNGMVLGSASTVTVSATGVIKTKQSTTSIQRGRARYKNLTFQSGGTLKLGYA